MKVAVRVERSIEVVHRAGLIDVGSAAAGDGHGSDDHAKVVDGGGGAEAAWGGGLEVLHSVVGGPDEGVVGGGVEEGITGNLAGVVDVVGVAVSAAESSQVAHLRIVGGAGGAVGGPEEGVLIGVVGVGPPDGSAAGIDGEGLGGILDVGVGGGGGGK